MPIVKNLNVPPEVQDLWNKSCVARPGYFGKKVDKKFYIHRRRNFTSLIARSQFQSISSIWNGLTDDERDAWDDAGGWSGQTGWDLFAQDTIYRKNNKLPGLAVPNGYHQFKVGLISLVSPVTEVHLYQNLPGFLGAKIYWYINYLSKLVSAGAGSYARMTVTITSYENDDTPDNATPNDFDFDLPAGSAWDWVTYEDDYSDSIVTGIVVHLHIYKMTGKLYLDGLGIEHDDTNFALDPQFNDFKNNWKVDTLPQGAFFKSVYPPDN